jgi:hypothetical protein
MDCGDARGWDYRGRLLQPKFQWREQPNGPGRREAMVLMLNADMAPAAKMRSPDAAMKQRIGADSPTRWASHAADCVFTQLRASKPAFNFSNGSIVPSGHSASTCQCSPSLRTTQKIGVPAVTFSPALKCWGETATTMQRACDLAPSTGVRGCRRVGGDQGMRGLSIRQMPDSGWATRAE